MLVHEWIDVTGGSEKVLDAMAEAFPDAEIHCLWNNAPQRFPDRKVRESWLSRTYLSRHKAAALPFMPFIWRNLKSGKDVDWMLVSSHLFAHHARLRRNSRHLRKFVYVHTPARYIWVPELDARGLRLVARLASPLLRKLDRARAKDTQVEFAANSQFVRERIQTAWGREAKVIYPPVDVAAIQSVKDWSTEVTEEERDELKRLPANFVLGASRFIPYKQLDLVVRAGESAGLPVVIAGSGPDEAALRDLASVATVPVYLFVNPSTAMLYALYQASMVYIFPAVEDFGIMPVEAMATGVPVIANAVGGAAESVLHEVTGMLIEDMTPSNVATAISYVAAMDREVIRHHARNFSKERFLREIHDWVLPQSTRSSNEA